jgi:hypothetical protein
MVLGHSFRSARNNLHGFCHAVERIPPSRRSGDEKFAPIRFVLCYKLFGGDTLMIAFDGLAVSEMLKT